MEQEEQAKDWHCANGAAPAIAFPAMSSFPSLVSILFSLQVSAYLPILHWIIPPQPRISPRAPQKGHHQGFKANPLGFKVTQSN